MKLPLTCAVVFTCLLPAQTGSPDQARAVPPAQPRTDAAREDASEDATDAVLRSMASAQRELRLLVQRNAELERSLCELRGQIAGGAAGLQMAVAAARTAATAAAELATQQAAQQRQRAADADAARRAAEGEAARWRQAHARLLQSSAAERDRDQARAARDRELAQRTELEIRAENRRLQDELARLRSAMQAAQREQETELRALTAPSRPNDARPPAGQAPVDASAGGVEPRPGATTPRRRPKID